MHKSADTTRPRSAAGSFAAGLAVVLVVAAAGLALWQLWPETSWLLGVVDESWPYESSAADVPADATARPPQETRLVIPRIGLNVQVYGGDPDRALTLGVYHHPETGEPGEADSIVLAGHRNRRALALLSRLDPGDPVLVYWSGREHVYRVTRTFVAEPDDPSVLEPASAEELRMYTCLPRFLGDKRTVVVALPE
ncbi:MAG: sortase [Actinomycetota bacterium]|nr:sortase [Actinomycetota bacterium]MDZ4179920.1 sortase [Coriobacteriia bacterium]